jgi:hypothetical protein
MTTADRKTFGDAMTALQVAFGQKPDVAVTNVYWALLSDLDLPDFLRGVGACGRTLKWFPKPAEIREAAGVSPASACAEAWDVVRAAIDRFDYTRSVDFGVLVNAVIRNLGGWRFLCDRSVTDLNVWTRKEFERVYALLSRKDTRELYGPALLGAFGGEPVRIAICGVVPDRQGKIGGDRLGVVRELADGKANT